MSRNRTLAKGLIALAACFLAGARGEETDLERVEIPASPAEAGEREGLEGGTWTAEGYGNPVEVKAVRLAGFEANRLLRMRYRPDGRDKAAARRVTGFASNRTGTLSCWVYAPEKDPPKFALAVCTGEAYFWQETEPVALRQGWNRLSFALEGLTWKSSESEWKHQSELKGREDVRAIVALVYNGASEGTLYVDALRMSRDGATPGLEALIEQLGDEQFSKREEAERALAEAGQRAFECLREAAEGGDPEVRLRAQRLLRRLAPGTPGGGKAMPGRRELQKP